MKPRARMFIADLIWFSSIVAVMAAIVLLATCDADAGGGDFDPQQQQTIERRPDDTGISDAAWAAGATIVVSALGLIGTIITVKVRRNRK